MWTVQPLAHAHRARVSKVRRRLDTARYDAILRSVEQSRSKLLLGAVLALSFPICGLAAGADLGRAGSSRDFGLLRPMGKASGQDLRGRELRRLELQRSTRAAQRDVRRKREERRIERSGTPQDLERYQHQERAQDAASNLSYDLDRRLIDRRASAGSSTNRETRFLDLQRDIERSLSKVVFERRQRRLEHELRTKGERRRLETGEGKP